MRSYLIIVLFFLVETGSAGADGLNVSPLIQSAAITATANQSFGGGPDKSEKRTPEDPSPFPILEARVSDRFGNERSAKGSIRLETEKGIVRYKGKVEATDSNPNDFLAPIVSLKGTVKVDLTVVAPDPGQPVKAVFRLTGEGPASLVGEEGKALPTNIVFQVWLNEELLLQPQDFSLGVEKGVPAPLRHGDVLTFLFEADFSLFSSGRADVVSTLNYTLSQ